jgi:hypothetical protein
MLVNVVLAIALFNEIYVPQEAVDAGDEGLKLGSTHGASC